MVASEWGAKLVSLSCEVEFTGKRPDSKLSEMACRAINCWPTCEAGGFELGTYLRRIACGVLAIDAVNCDCSMGRPCGRER